MSRAKVALQLVATNAPGPRWGLLRRSCQAFALVAITLGPLLGGWQRLDAYAMGAWDDRGWTLTEGVARVLPLGDAPATAHRLNVVLGGGVAAEYLGVPFVDPLAGLLSLVGGGVSGAFLLGWGLPLALGLVAGRAFCGWFCPYGTVARSVEAVLKRLPWRPRLLRVPERRPLRWILLSGALGAGGLGSATLLYACLPHALLQHSVYALWLLGGAGAGLGWLLGLVIAGIVLGPTTYCAALCPTGAALSLLGGRRLARLTLAAPDRCGKHCNFCSRACWLGLDPASGDPGPDCDGCGRCHAVCPRTNLRVGVSLPWTRRARSAATLALALALIPSRSRASTDSADAAGDRPRLVFQTRARQGATTVWVSVADLSTLQLDPDSASPAGSDRLAVVLFRGAPTEPDPIGRRERRPTYDGPLQVELWHLGAPAPRVLTFRTPTEPRSTPRRSVYGADLGRSLEPGARLVIRPVPTWLDRPVTITVPDRAPRSTARMLWALAAGALFFSGLCSLALGVPPARRERAAD